MFAVMKDSDYATKPKFLKNFWEDWKAILGKNHIYDWAQVEKERKKNMSAEVI
jgi:DNA topoisomerase-1